MQGYKISLVMALVAELTGCSKSLSTASGMANPAAAKLDSSQFYDSINWTGAAMVAARTAIASQTVSAYSASILAKLTDSSVSIDGTTISGVRSSYLKSQATVTALNARYPSMRAFLKAFGVDIMGRPD